LRGRAAAEARFLVLPLALFAFRGFSVVPATASLKALVAVETISLPASTVALAASATTSCADFATSTLAFAASDSASSVEARTPSSSLSVARSPSIVTSLRKKCAPSVTSRFAQGQSQPARKPVEDLRRGWWRSATLGLLRTSLLSRCMSQTASATSWIESMTSWGSSLWISWPRFVLVTFTRRTHPQ